MSDKKEIVEKFFERGYLLTPKALDFLLKTRNWLKMLESVKNIDKLILTDDDLSKFNTYEDRVKILKNLTNKPTELTTENFTNFYLSKLEKMRLIITSKINKNFMSLDKINNQKDIYIMGIVKEVKTENTKKIIEIEDLTGTRTVIFEKELTEKEIDIDDVIVIRADALNETLFAKEILYPDIPLRQPTKGFGEIAAISDLHLEEAPTDNLKKFIDFFNRSNMKFLLVVGDIGDMNKFNDIIKRLTKKTIFLIPGEKDSSDYPCLPIEVRNENIVSLSNPALIEINNVKVLLIHRFDIDMFRKRYLGKSKLILDEDYLVLDYVPDIVVCGHSHEPGIVNYKSVTIVNPGSLLTDFRPTVINLETREYEQLRF